MTGYTVNTGATVKFSEGWDRIFGGTPGSSGKAAVPGPKPSPASKKASASVKAAKKSAGKQSSGKTVKSKQAAQSARTSGKR
jgi:hypothetical protein